MKKKKFVTDHDLIQDAIEAKPGMTVPEIIHATKVSRAPANRALKFMTEKGWITRKRVGRNYTYYPN